MILVGERGVTISFWSRFRYKHWDVCLKGVTSWRMMTRSSEGQEGQKNYGARGLPQEKGLLKEQSDHQNWTSRDFQTCKIQNSKPKSSRTPETHHGMDGPEGTSQTATTAMTASSRTTIPNWNEWKMEKRNKERSKHFRDYGQQFHQDGKQVGKGHTHTKTQTHCTRKTQIYAFSNAENILLSHTCGQRMCTLIKGTEHAKWKHIHTRARTHAIKMFPSLSMCIFIVGYNFYPTQ